MALIKCKECGKEISEDASKCPHCGCPKYTVRISKKGMTIINVVGVLLILGLILSCIYYNKNYNDYKKTIKSKNNNTYYNYSNY